MRLPDLDLSVDHECQAGGASVSGGPHLPPATIPIRGNQGRILRAHANPHSHPPRESVGLDVVQRRLRFMDTAMVARAPAQLPRRARQRELGRDAQKQRLLEVRAGRPPRRSSRTSRPTPMPSVELGSLFFPSRQVRLPTTQCRFELVDGGEGVAVLRLLCTTAKSD